MIQSKKLILLLLPLWLILACFGLQAQNSSPYELSLGKEAALYGGGGLFGLVYLQLNKKNTGLTERQIDLLNRKNIPGFDRNASYNWSFTAGHNSDLLLYSAGIAPVLMLLDKKVRDDAANYGVLASQVYLINFALTSVTKAIALRTRPFAYNPTVPLEKKLKQDARYSFYSGHTSTAAAHFFFIAQTYADYHPDSKFKPFMWGICATLPATMGLLRYKAGKHFLSDVIVGYIAGAAVGLLVPRLHRKKSP